MKILKGDHPILQLTAHDVPVDDITDKNIVEFIDGMWATLKQSGGIGLAANQIGVLERIIVVHTKDFKQELINPVITDYSDHTVKSSEGCLSYPGKKVMVKRHKSIRVKGYNRYGKSVGFQLKGLAARCVQHEIDHLNGVTIL